MYSNPDRRWISQDPAQPEGMQCNDPVGRDPDNTRLLPIGFLGQVLDALLKGLARGMTI